LTGTRAQENLQWNAACRAVQGWILDGGFHPAVIWDSEQPGLHMLRVVAIAYLAGEHLNQFFVCLINVRPTGESSGHIGLEKFGGEFELEALRLSYLVFGRRGRLADSWKATA
jgi:hypothetical protein